MAGADALQRRIASVGALARVGRRACCGFPERAVGVDQRAALIEIGAVEQARHGRGDEIRIGEIAVAVGEGEALGLDDAMHRFDRHRHLAEIEGLDQPEHLADGDGARGGRRRAANVKAAIEHADGLAQLGAIVGEILGSELARPSRIVLHGGGDVASDWASVEGGRSVASDDFERRGEGGARQPVALGPRLAGGIKEIGARRRREACRAVVV